MKNLSRLILLTLGVFLLSHCKFQESTARENNWNKHLAKSNNIYSEFQYEDKSVNGCDYRIYFIDAHYKAGIAIINKTQDRLMKRKLELEIKVLQKQLEE